MSNADFILLWLVMMALFLGVYANRRIDKLEDEKKDTKKEF